VTVHVFRAAMPFYTRQTDVDVWIQRCMNEVRSHGDRIVAWSLSPDFHSRGYRTSIGGKSPVLVEPETFVLTIESEE
jgi:hypothetical protein